MFDQEGSGPVDADFSIRIDIVRDFHCANNPNPYVINAVRGTILNQMLREFPDGSVVDMSLEASGNCMVAGLRNFGYMYSLSDWLFLASSKMEDWRANAF